MKKLSIYFLFFFILLQNGCGIFIKIKKNDGIYIPAGIDSLTAVVSDSITNRLFVSESKKHRARSLFNKAEKNYEIADSLWLILTSLSTNSRDSLEDNQKHEKDKIFKKIGQAEHDLKKAKKLNPFELNINDVLANVFFLHGNLSADSKFYTKSTQELMKILSKEKCDHLLYYRLGENYFKLKDWEKAYQNYKQAENVLLKTAFLNAKKEIKLLAGSYVAIDSVDTNIHFRYIYYQGITVAKLYNTELALSLFQRAQQISPTQNQLQLVDNYTKWIRWDGGNIAASEKKNIYLNYLKEKKYNQAKSGFEKLIKELNTQKAKDEIGWQISLIEYEFLNMKEKGCQRLYEIVTRTPVNKNSGLPIDPNYKQYISDCGKMFFKLGLDYKKRSKYKDAFKYFANASQISWFGKWKSLLEIAKLSIHNPEKTLIIIKQILNGQHNLNKSQQLNALTLKLNALKRFGQKRIEETKETYRQIRSLQNRLN